MTKIRTIFLAVLFFYCFFGGFQSQVLAADNTPCEDLGVSGTLIDPSQFEEETVNEVYVQFSVINMADDGYKIKVFDNTQLSTVEETNPAVGWKQKTSTTTDLTFSLTSQAALTGDDAGNNSTDVHSIYLYSQFNGSGDALCKLGEYTVKKGGLRCTEQLVISQVRKDAKNNDQECFANTGDSCLDINSPIKFSVKGALENNEPALIAAFNLTGSGNSQTIYTQTPGTFVWDTKTFTEGLYSGDLSNKGGASYSGFNCNGFEFQVKQKCPATDCDTTPNTGQGATTIGPDSFSLCKQISEDQVDSRGFSLRDQCLECTGGSVEDEKDGGVWTAIGCIKRDPTSIIERLIRVGLGLSGGVALITFLAAGFIFSTSQGDPKEYGKAKEMMTASIVGLIFIIFSITILEFIGYSILKIPGFGG